MKNLQNLSKNLEFTHMEDEANMSEMLKQQSLIDLVSKGYEMQLSEKDQTIQEKDALIKVLRRKLRYYREEIYGKPRKDWKVTYR